MLELLLVGFSLVATNISHSLIVVTRFAGCDLYWLPLQLRYDQQPIQYESYYSWSYLRNTANALAWLCMIIQSIRYVILTSGLHALAGLCYEQSSLKNLDQTQTLELSYYLILIGLTVRQLKRNLSWVKTA